LDSVANHTSPADPTAWSAELANRLYPLDHRDGIRRSQRGALYERGQYVMGLDEDEQRARENIPANYQRYFHGFGPIEDFNNQFQLENFQLDALADLDQTNGVVADYLKRAHAFWLEHFPNLAGYRMDTIKHVPFAYWQRFDSELFERFPNAEVIGEYYGGGPFNAGSRQYFRNTHATMFDFDFRSAVQDVFLNRAPMSRFTELWSADPGLKDARSLVTFIDNHDMPRLRGQGMSYRAMRQAIALMFASRGIPCVYYGLEQDLFVEQDPGDPYNRPMQTRFDRQHQFYREIKKLAALRRDNTALRYGSTHVVHLSENILGFERVEGDSKVLFITSKNPIEGHNNFDLTGLHLPDGLYSDILSDQEYVVRGGRVAVSLANGDTVLLSSTRRHDLGSRIPE
jgi:glycosidase